MRRLTLDRAETPELGARLAIDHTLAHLDADLRWLDETRERVARDTTGTGGRAAARRTGGAR